MRKKKIDTPVKYRGASVLPGDFRSFMEEWSTRRAEEEHVETIEEANDFEIHDEEDEDFFGHYTVYEMHAQAEENLKDMEKYQAQMDAVDPSSSLSSQDDSQDRGAESSDSDDRARSLNPHAQSAPIEQDSQHD